MALCVVPAVTVVRLLWSTVRGPLPPRRGPQPSSPSSSCASEGSSHYCTFFLDLDSRGALLGIDRMGASLGSMNGPSCVCVCHFPLRITKCRPEYCSKPGDRTWQHTGTKLPQQQPRGKMKDAVHGQLVRAHVWKSVRYV